MQINSPLTEPELQKLAADIKILLMDVDGVLTDGRLYFVPGPDGKMTETKAFDSQDGIALRWLSWYGVKTGVISGRDSPATLERAQQVGMTWVFQGHIEKIPLFEKIMSEANVSSEQVAYVGDDLTDVVIMRRVGLSFATANARTEVKSSAKVVTSSFGGAGAVREVVEVLLKARGVWGELLKKYEVLV
jgi:3-deoxy-D-manno-octulosonate 8-phosphate phosphatase (KDO 8-P phosphatase)